MAISTNGTVLARLAGALYNTQMSNATYKEVASLDPSALADVLYARDFSASTDAAVATTLVTNLGLASVTGLDNWVAAQLTAAGSHKGAKVVELLNSFAQMTADTTYGAYATAFNTKVDAALALSQTTDNAGGTFAAAGVVVVTGKTFTLTSGVDAVTGTAVDDIIKASTTTLNAYDVVAGGSGSDTLTVQDTVLIPNLGSATVTGVESLVLSTTKAVGQVEVAAGATVGAVAATAGAAATVVITADYTAGTDLSNGGTETIVINGVTYSTGTITIGGTSAGTDNAATASAIATKINAVLGASVASASGASVTVTSPYAGGTLPTIDALHGGEVPTAATTKALATGAQSQLIQFALTATTGAAANTFAVTVDGVSYGSVIKDTTSSNVTAGAEGIVSITNTALNAKLGTTGVAYATNVGGTVTVAAPSAGTALPNITITSSGTDGAAVTRSEVRANAVASAAGTSAAGTAEAAFSAAGIAGLETLSVTAVDASVLSALKTTNVTATVSAGSLKITGGKDVIAKTAGGFTGAEIAGAVTLTESKGGDISVKGGTAVTITAKGAKLDTAGTAVDTVYDTDVVLGEDSSYAADPLIASGLPQADTKIKTQPTDNVVITNVTTYTDTSGQATAQYSSGDATVYARGSTSVSIATAGAVTVKDVATNSFTGASNTSTKGASTLNTVRLDGHNNATGAITSDALTNLTVVNAGASSAVTVTNSTAAGHALSLTLGNNASGSAITDDTATTVTVNTEAQTISTAANASKSFVNLNAAKATTLTFNNAQAVELSGTGTLDGSTKVTSIDANGAGALTLGDITDATKLTVIDGSDAAGAIKVTIGGTGSYGLTVTGGSGNDVVTIKDGADSSHKTTLAAGTSTTGAAITTTLNLGAGNDSLLTSANNYVTIGAGAVINGGDGEDTVAARLITGGNSTLFTNFEVLGLDSSGTFDTDLLASATKFSLLAQGGTYTNVNTSQSLTIAADVTAGTNTLQFGTAESTGTTDSYSINFSYADRTTAANASANDVDGGVIVIEDIETVNLSSSGTGNMANHVNLVDTKARILNLSGDKNLNLDFGSTDNDDTTTTNYFGTTSSSDTDLGGVSLIDASSMTGKLDINTTDVGTAYAGLTVKGGTAADTIVLAQTSKITVDAGAGADTITTAGKTTVATGEGKDEVIVAASKVGTLADTSTYVATEAEAIASMVTITDAAIGDKIDFATSDTAGTAAAFGSKVSVASATTLLEALNAMANDVTSTSNGALTWTVYGGNTYVLFDASSSSSLGVSVNDIVVKLNGVYDLSTALIGGDAGLLVLA